MSCLLPPLCFSSCIVESDLAWRWVAWVKLISPGASSCPAREVGAQRRVPLSVFPGTLGTELIRVKGDPKVAKLVQDVFEYLSDRPAPFSAHVQPPRWLGVKYAASDNDSLLRSNSSSFKSLCRSEALLPEPCQGYTPTPLIICKYKEDPDTVPSQPERNRWSASGNGRQGCFTSFHSTFLSVALDAAQLSSQTFCLGELADCQVLRSNSRLETAPYHLRGDVLSMHLLPIPADVPACGSGCDI
ncbi:hypothetical protein BKA70DRAFT_1229859 [Coprinopsis sp. MPI-PUGE-AT-0042]|nr:hypothetical protein BKA70DRAFT_1229859 [Coprinopsis sp. MPI-PUGE-AT-0042]